MYSGGYSPDGRGSCQCYTSSRWPFCTSDTHPTFHSSRGGESHAKRWHVPYVCAPSCSVFFPVGLYMKVKIHLKQANCASHFSTLYVASRMVAPVDPNRQIPQSVPPGVSSVVGAHPRAFTPVMHHTPSPYGLSQPVMVYCLFWFLDINFDSFFLLLFVARTFIFVQYYIYKYFVTSIFILLALSLYTMSLQ